MSDKFAWVRLRAAIDRKPDATQVTINRETAEEMLAEINRLRNGGCARDQTTTQYCAEAAGKDAEIERLRADLRLAVMSDSETCKVLEREVERLLKSRNRWAKKYNDLLAKHRAVLGEKP